MHLSRIAGMICLAVTVWLAALPARAVTILRDPDIEHALKQLATPVLRAAGLGNHVRVLVIDDHSLNAFVIDSRHIFIHSGLLLKMKSPGMLQAVIAHEAAHIANGHLARRMSNLSTARTAANLGMALAMAAAASGQTRGAAGLAMGVQSSALRMFLAHSRAEEAAADQSAVRYMTAAGIDPAGAVAMHELFRGQESLSQARQDPYTRSHPLTRDRVRAMKAYAAGYGGPKAATPEAQYWFARAKGKLSAFQRSPKWTLQRAGEEPARDVRLMREAIAHHRRSATAKALSAINTAIKLRPRDPYYHELKGQILLESRQFAGAVASYGTAVKLAPKEALILGGYGRALLAAGRPKQALAALEKSRGRDFRDTRVLRDLGAAYARIGQPGMAALATAERYALQGRLKDAGLHAKRASDLLARGSGGWRRAQDVLRAAEAHEKRRKK